jgi:predicted transcriptional regulator of viral defense system
MTKGDQNITRQPLGSQEADFLARIGTSGIFSLDDARQMLPKVRPDHVRQFLHRLQEKGWVSRIAPSRYAVIPISSGVERTPQIHEFVIAMELVKPATIAYFSAMNHHGFTEQIPGIVFIATDHRVSRSKRQSLGIEYRIVSLKKDKYFGLEQAWVADSPFTITNREKTLIDGLDLPRYVGGVGVVAKAIYEAWDSLNERRLREYSGRIGNTAVAKRLGYLMESQGVGDAEMLRKSVRLAKGFSSLDPTLPDDGTYNRRWGLLINSKGYD